MYWALLEFVAEGYLHTNHMYQIRIRLHSMSLMRSDFRPDEFLFVVAAELLSPALVFCDICTHAQIKHKRMRVFTVYLAWVMALPLRNRSNTTIVPSTTQMAFKLRKRGSSHANTHAVWNTLKRSTCESPTAKYRIHVCVQCYTHTAMTLTHTYALQRWRGARDISASLFGMLLILIYVCNAQHFCAPNFEIFMCACVRVLDGFTRFASFVSIFCTVFVVCRPFGRSYLFLFIWNGSSKCYEPSPSTSMSECCTPIDR